MNVNILEPIDNGKIVGTPEAIAKHLREMIPTYDNHRLKKTLDQLNELMKDINAEIRNQARKAETLRNETNRIKAEKDRAYLSDCYSELQKVRKIIYKRIAETEKFNTTAPVPNTLIQNYIATMELVGSFGEILDYSGGSDPTKLTGIEVSKSFENQLAKIETAYIIDAIGYYVSKYREAGGNTPEIQYQDNEEWDSYMITDTFDNICNNCQAKGLVRKKIKEVLFGKDKPLQYITLFLPIDETKKAYKKVQFINSVIEEGTKTQPKGWYAKEEYAGDMTRVGLVTLQVSAKLYRFLDPQYRDRKTRGIDISGGFHMRPLAHSDSVKNMFEEMRRLSETVYRNKMQLDMTGFDNEKGLRAVSYIMYNWNKGLQKRTQNMIVTHKELSDNGYLPSYGHKSNSKKREKRARDVDAIARVIATIIETENLKDSFPRCNGAFSDQDAFSVILTLEKKEIPPQIP